MAGTPPTHSAPPRAASRGGPAGRPTPVLVPTEALAGQPDIPLNKDVTTVGSSQTCRLVLQSRTVSRHHAVFLVDGGTTFVADLASRTGVLVNGRPVREAELNPGDRVQIGKFVFRYRSADGPPAQPVAPAPAASAVVTGVLAIPLPGRIALIGRRETSDIALVGDPGVSAAHAALFHAGGQWYVRDLSSRTGTTVNGQAIVQRVVTFGDHIGVGAATIQFEPTAAVPGHAAVASAAPALSPAPSPAPDPLPLAAEEDDIGKAVDDAMTPAPALPAIPFGVVAAAHPAAVGRPPTEPSPEPPSAEVSSPAPPLPQPRAWDAPGTFDLAEPDPLAAGPAHPVVPPEPHPKSWDVEPAPHAPTEPTESPLAPGFSLEPVNPQADEPLAGPLEIGEPSDATPSEEPLAHGFSLDPLPLAEPEPAADAVPTSPHAALWTAVLPDVGASEPLPLHEEASADATPAPAEPVPGTDEPLQAATWGAVLPEVELSDPPSPPDHPAADVFLAPAEHSGEFAEPPGSAEPWDRGDAADGVPDVAPPPDVAGPTEPTPNAALAWEATVAGEGDHAPAEPLPAVDPSGPPAIAALQNQPPAGAAPVAELMGPVDDFVFVPGQAVAAAALPDVIFWGDADDLHAPVPTPPAADRPDVVAPTERVDGPVSDAFFAPGEAAVVVGPTEATAKQLRSEGLDPALAVSSSDTGAADVPPPLDVVGTDLLPGEAVAAEPWLAEDAPPTTDTQTVAAAPPVAAAETFALADPSATEVLPAAAVDVEPRVAEGVEPAVESAAAEAVGTVGEVEPLVEPSAAHASGPVTLGGDVPAGVLTDETVAIEPSPAGGVAATVASTADVPNVAIEPSQRAEPVVGIVPTEGGQVAEIVGTPSGVGAVDGTSAVVAVESTEVAAEMSAAVPFVGTAATSPEDGAETNGLLLDEPGVTEFSGAPNGTAPVDPVATDAVGVGIAATPSAGSGAPGSASMADAVDPWDAVLDLLPANTESAPVGSGSDDSFSVVVTTDEPAGFDLDVSDPSPAMDEWDDLNLLDLNDPADPQLAGAAAPMDLGLSHPPAVDAAPPGDVDPVEAARETAAPPDAGSVGTAVAAPDADPAPTFGAVVNVGLAAATVTATEALAPVVEFAAVVGGAAVETFAAVSDAALTQPPPELPPSPLAEDDDLAFLDFDLDAGATVPPAAEGPAGDNVELAESAVPSEPPQRVETVTEPVTEPVAEAGVASAAPVPRLLARVVIPPPPEPEVGPAPEPATGPAAEVPPMSGAPVSGPSPFGFDFQGGSFLGGMPLPLNGPPPTLPAGGVVFDMPPAEPPRARPPAPSAPLGLTGLVTGTAPPAERELPVPMPVAPVGLVNGPSGVRPPPPPPPPFVPGNGRPRSAEVFSQMAGPIDPQAAFPARPGRADQYQIPEVDRSAPAADAAARGEPGVGGPIPPAVRPLPNTLANNERLIPADMPRRAKVRRLVAALVVLPIVWGVLVYCFLSKTATVVGTLRFNGLSTQSESARRLFIGDQVSALFGDDVRNTARAVLVNRGKPTGPTEDAASMERAMADQTIDRKWGPDDLTLTYLAHDGDQGKAQLEALMSALRVRDEFLTDKRATAAHELDASTADAKAAKAADDDLKAQRREQTRLAEDRPDKATADALDRAADSAARKLESVRAERAATESVLDGWKKQDPSKPVDPNLDPEVTNLRRQLTPIQAQIAKAKQLATMNGGPAATGDDDPLLVVLQQQADRLQARLDRRVADLARDQATPPEERARQRESAIESLSVQVATLKRSESDAAAASATAAAAAADARAKVDAAHAAEARAADLYNKLMDADQTLRQASDDQAEKQRALDATVVVDGSASTNPDVAVRGESDPRLAVTLVGAGVIAVAIFALLLAVAGTGEDVTGLDGETGDDGSAKPNPSDPAAAEERQPVEV